MYLASYPSGVTPARVLGNLVGVGRDGATALGNGGSGINWLFEQAVSVGGVGPVEGNVIAFNWFDAGSWCSRRYWMRPRAA